MRRLRILSEYQSGFGAIGVIALVLLIGVSGLVAYRVMSAPPEHPQSKSAEDSMQVKASDADPDQLVLYNFGVQSLGDVLVTSDTLRDYQSSGHKGFYAFGDKLANTGKTNPNFEFASMQPGTKIVAALDGIVAFIKEQPETADSEVFLQPRENSAWVVGYDHISNVVVKKGDPIKAGDVIGEPTAQGNGLLRYEFQINKKENGQELSHCPSAYLAESVRAQTLSQLTEMMRRWETISGLELYDIESQKPVGCMAETMQP